MDGLDHKLLNYQNNNLLIVHILYLMDVKVDYKKMDLHILQKKVDYVQNQNIHIQQEMVHVKHHHAVKNMIQYLDIKK